MLKRWRGASRNGPQIVSDGQQPLDHDGMIELPAPPKLMRLAMRPEPKLASRARMTVQILRRGLGAASGSNASPGFTASFLRSGGGARPPEIAAQEGPHSHAGRARRAQSDDWHSRCERGKTGGAFATAGRARRVCTAGVMGRRTRCVSFEPPTSATMNAPVASGHFLKHSGLAHG